MHKPEDYADEIYERTIGTLTERSRLEGFDLAAVEAEFEALTVYEGHGGDGRTAFKDAEIEGQILAYQVFLHRKKTAEGGE